MDKKSNRIQWIDFAKGILMLLVIVGHTVEMGKQPDNIIRGVIYSFHMPCFFLIGGLTFKTHEDMSGAWKGIRKSFLRLIIPAVLIFAVKQLVLLVQSGGVTGGGFWSGKALSLLFASGVSFGINGTTIADVGYLWFLFVLFEIRVIYELLAVKIKRAGVMAGVLLGFMVAGVAIGHYVWLPFSLDIALASAVFFHVGVLTGQRITDKISIKIAAIAMVIWVGTLGVTYYFVGTCMELACRKYVLFPLGYVTAMAATVVFLYISQKMADLKVMTAINMMGKNSFKLLMVHCLDGMAAPIWKMTESGVINAILRIVLDLAVLAVVCMALKLISKIKKAEA